MKNQDYKLKYNDLKIKFMDAVDLAFRLGFEQGAQNAQVQQAQAAAAAQPGQPGQDPNAPPGEDMNSPESPDGSELDSHINTLEGMLAGSKQGSPDQAALQKSLNEVKAFQLSLKTASDLKKSEKAIAEIGKAVKGTFTISKKAAQNLSQPAQKALNSQEQIIDDLMKSFDEEQKKAVSTIEKTLGFEQLLKG